MHSKHACALIFSIFICAFQILNASSLDSLSKNLAKGASKLKTKKIAVLSFPYHDGKISSGSSLISERLTTQIVGKKGLVVIERRLIEQLLAEKMLNETGVVDAENLKVIGTVLGADAVVTGTLIDLDNGQTEINARMIRTDSGEVLSAAQESIERTWKDAPLFPKPKQLAVKKTEPVGLSPEELQELNEIRKRDELEMEQKSTPRSGKIPMKLSNESFPPDRRFYLANESAYPNKKKIQDSSNDPNSQQYENAYEDGYSDASREAMAAKYEEEARARKKEQELKAAKPSENVRKLGTVTSDSENRGSFSTNKSSPFSPNRR